MDFRSRLDAGDPLYGTIVTLTTPQVSDALARMGFDWLWLDMEHGPLDLAIVQSLIQGAGPECACLVRVPANDPVWLQRVLDLGPAGVIVPHVASADEARSAVAACRYPPRGRRSIGIGRAQGYGTELADSLKTAHERVLVIPQIEDGSAVEDIDAILEIEGIDCVVVGPFDLSASLGHPGALDHPEVTRAIRRVLSACEAAGKHAGIFAGTTAFARAWRAEGMQLVALSVDVSLLGDAARAVLSEVQGVAPPS
ncbi:MAG: aldolase/citrate lyase family protein [Myxococcota bacterium]|nr:aldolase/citrate lyase family protein [Myxococcota bacterium]